MMLDRRAIVSGSLLVLFLFGFSACNSRTGAQSQTAKDDQTREKVADATEKAKEESQKAALQIDEAAREAKHEAKVAAQGVKEGWTRGHGGKLDLNSATETELRGLPGLSQSEARRIVNERPYNTKQELVTKGILSQEKYDNIQDQLIVQEPAARE